MKKKLDKTEMENVTGGTGDDIHYDQIVLTADVENSFYIKKEETVKAKK